MNKVQLNFNSVYRKVHFREPFLMQEKFPPFALNNEYTYCIFHKTNAELDNPAVLSEFQKQMYAVEFDKLLQLQEIAKNRSGNIFTRLKAMEKQGYEGICKKVSSETLGALTSLKKETISALNDFQLYRICEFDTGNRSVADGLLALEKEFSYDELLRLSQRQNSVIINTWISMQNLNKEQFNRLTSYIHEIAKR